MLCTSANFAFLYVVLLDVLLFVTGSSGTASEMNAERRCGAARLPLFVDSSLVAAQNFEDCS
jgi:hypothetical protein